jgi:predicted nucleotidyltransferase
METAVPSVIQPLMNTYLHALEPLRAHVYGIYIYGSIALEAFEEQESDIDIVALTQGEWTTSELIQLEHIHTQLIQQHSFGGRLASLYVPFADIGKYNTEIAPYPYIADGTFHTAGYFDLNAVTWWILKNNGICLLGPERSALPIETEWKEVLKAMDYNLHTYWAGKAATADLFLSDYWVMSCVATLCRILTAIEEGKIIAKSPALIHWRDRLPMNFRLLIDEAWRIRHDPSLPSLFPSPTERMSETLAFIQYGRERGRKGLDASF